MQSIIIRLTLLGFLLTTWSVELVAQQAASPARRGKSSKQTCDGALDIVPVKAVTFVRKRRPAPKESPAPSGAAERKPEKR